ncbi:MAG: hypothetical protein HOO92_08880 [Methylococcaceae bacterium]|nr:hypothetical protein [Methylococcaceae bacterium]
MAHQQNEVCHHIENLKPCPTPEELQLLRKGLRKQKIPEMLVDWHGGHPELGEFTIISKNAETFVEWNAKTSNKKHFGLDDLCNDPNLELERLEFGWLIANLAELDKLHEFEDINIPDPAYEMEEKARVWNFYEKIEKRWRHWAIVPAKHMLFSK